jgi:hypothetical protein
MRKLLVAVISIVFQIISINCLFAEWSQPILISQPGTGYYPQVLAHNDTIHVVFENTRQYDKISYIKSTNSGLNWTQDIVLSNQGCQTLFPRITKWNWKLYVTWYAQFYEGNSRFNIGVNSSVNDGSTWNSTEYLFNPNLEHLSYYADSATDSLINLTFSANTGNSMYFYSMRSINFGEDWSIPQYITTSNFVSIPDQVSYGNFCHFVWPGYISLHDHEETFYLRSTDGGQNWEDNLPISNIDSIPSYFPAITVNEIGSVFITWMDFKYSPNFTTGDIFIRQSLDSGATWLPEQQLTFNHYAMWSDVASRGDTIFVVYEDFRPENGWRGIYCTYSLDSGINWVDPERLDTNEYDSFNPSVSMSNGRVYVIWEEAHDNPDSCGIMFCRWNPEPDAIDGESEQEPAQFSLSAYPNPFNSATTITLSGAEQAEIGIYDITGRLITTLHTVGGQALWDAGAYSSGLYFARLAGEKASTIKLVLVK